MKKKYRCYKVLYKQDIYSGEKKVIRRDFAGETFAESTAKAISNIRYRMRGKVATSCRFGYGDSDMYETYEAVEM